MTKKRDARRLSARERKDRLNSEKVLIRAALDNDATTKKELSKQTDLAIWKINYIFESDEELYAAFKVRRRILVDVAADNIVAIVNDKSDPNHFAASKYVLAKYKSDLDDVLERGDEAMSIEIGKGGKSTANPVTITFGKSENKKDK